ncbi:helix-turn-helix domain-containing protein [Thalassorhabdus alkalitolerans]|uniref:Helix-turn-helix domain-containing protein n=1 Tax=Thalassorhabdus alkalitolerans TaxID=2282697 RepID=A0ABW0YSY4_9BACI|nr:helix-turn-helix transcriptional regulator [Thalassobacillus sp. C254]
MEKQHWARRIRAYRKLKGYTQQSFANELGVSVSLLGDVERGTRIPDEEFIEKVTEALGISKHELQSG